MDPQIAQEMKEMPRHCIFATSGHKNIAPRPKNAIQGQSRRFLLILPSHCQSGRKCRSMAANGRKLPQCRLDGNNGNQPKLANWQTARWRAAASKQQHGKQINGGKQTMWQDDRQ
jgi:hypothetical protein